MRGFTENLARQLDDGRVFSRVVATLTIVSGYLAVVLFGVSLIPLFEGEKQFGDWLLSLYSAACLIGTGLVVFFLCSIRGREIRDVVTGSHLVPRVLARFIRCMGECFAVTVIGLGLIIVMLQLVKGGTFSLEVLQILNPQAASPLAMGSPPTDFPFWTKLLLAVFSGFSSFLSAFILLAVHYLVASVIEVLFEISDSTRRTRELCEMEARDPA